MQCGLQKYTFQVVSFRIERTISLSRLAKVSKLISLCNLQPRTKELCWRLLDSRLLAKTAYYEKVDTGLYCGDVLSTPFFSSVFSVNVLLFTVHPLQRDEKAVNEGDEKKFDPSGYDKDLVESLERDIVQKNPNVHW